MRLSTPNGLDDRRPDRLTTHHDPLLGKQILVVAQTEYKAMVRPDRIGNDGSWKTVARQTRLANLADHRSELGHLGLWPTP